MDLNCPSVASLESLAMSCEQATCDENISHRKIRKLDPDFFKPMLDVYDVGLIDLINERLLYDLPEPEIIRAKLSNMNVYGASRSFLARRPMTITARPSQEKGHPSRCLLTRLVVETCLDLLSFSIQRHMKEAPS